MIRTDLAHESVCGWEKENPSPVNGLHRDAFKKGSLYISRIHLEKGDAAKKLDKTPGSYTTIFAKGGLESYPDDFEERSYALAEEIKHLCPDLSKTLVVGLGNNNITPDSLGPKTAAMVFATRHIKRLAADVDTKNLAEVAVIAAGVTGQTGFEVVEIVNALCRENNFTAVIAIDALACSETENLAATIQLSDTGISPGSGVCNSRRELSSQTLGTNVLAVGVPTVIDMETIAESVFLQSAPPHRMSRLMVTPRGIDTVVDRSARLIAMGINLALFPSLDFEEITALIQ